MYTTFFGIKLIKHTTQRTNKVFSQSAWQWHVWILDSKYNLQYRDDEQSHRGELFQHTTPYSANKPPHTTPKSKLTNQLACYVIWPEVDSNCSTKFLIKSLNKAIHSVYTIPISRQSTPFKAQAEKSSCTCRSLCNVIDTHYPTSADTVMKPKPIKHFN